MKTFSLSSIPGEYFDQFVDQCPGDMLKHIVQHGPRKYVPEILRVRPKAIRHLDPKVMSWLTPRKIDRFNEIAVRSSIWSFIHIKNPSIRVQLIAIEKNPNQLRLIKNPSLKVQRAALHRWHTMDRKINPADSVSYGRDEDCIPTILVYDNPKPRMEFLKFFAINYPRYFYEPFNRPSDHIDKDWRKNTYVDVFPWERVPEFQEWLIQQDLTNINKIPADKLLPRLKKKYRYALGLTKSGVLK